MRVWIGKEEIQKFRKDLVKQPGILRSNLLKAMTLATLFVEGEAKKGLPQMVDGYGKGVDRGRLRSSITSKVSQNEKGDVVGEVGTNVAYARHLEYGTKRHFVPFKVAPDLLIWARRHGKLPKISKAVQRRIRGIVKVAKYREVMGGLFVTGPRLWYMHGALERSQGKLIRYLSKIMEAR